MTDTIDRVRANYDGPGLVHRSKAALAGVAAEDEPLTVPQLAMLDQFHARGDAEVHRLLKPGGRFATYDLAFKGGDVIYPAPWARDASTSVLLSAEDTRAALEAASFKATLWRDDTQTALDWFMATTGSLPPAGPNLGVIMGPEFPTITGNRGRNIREGRLGVISAVLTRTLRNPLILTVTGRARSSWRRTQHSQSPPGSRNSDRGQLQLIDLAQRRLGPLRLQART